MKEERVVSMVWMVWMKRKKEERVVCMVCMVEVDTRKVRCGIQLAAIVVSETTLKLNVGQTLSKGRRTEEGDIAEEGMVGEGKVVVRREEEEREGRWDVIYVIIQTISLAIALTICFVHLSTLLPSTTLHSHPLPV